MVRVDCTPSSWSSIRTMTTTICPIGQAHHGPSRKTTRIFRLRGWDRLQSVTRCWRDSRPGQFGKILPAPRITYLVHARRGIIPACVLFLPAWRYDRECCKAARDVKKRIQKLFGNRNRKSGIVLPIFPNPDSRITDNYMRKGQKPAKFVKDVPRPERITVALLKLHPLPKRISTPRPSMCWESALESMRKRRGSPLRFDGLW